MNEVTKAGYHFLPLRGVLNIGIINTPHKGLCVHNNCKYVGMRHIILARGLHLTYLVLGDI